MTPSTPDPLSARSAAKVLPVVEAVTFKRIREGDFLEIRSEETTAIEWVIRGKKCWAKIPPGVQATVKRAKKGGEP